MRPLGWVLIQDDWCPYKKRNLGHRHTQRGDHVRTWGEESHPQAKETGLRRHQSTQHLDLGTQPPELRKYAPVVQVAQSVVLGYGSLSRQRHQHKVSQGYSGASAVS